jgi:hypothetical protein
MRREASRLLYGLETRADLSRTLFVEMRDLVNRCRALDERILGKTMLLMVDEYQSASDFDDRTKALVTAVGFLEKLTTRLSPWYIKYEKLVVALVSILGLITGGLQIAKTLTQA